MLAYHRESGSVGTAKPRCVTQRSICNILRASTEAQNWEFNSFFRNPFSGCEGWAFSFLEEKKELGGERLLRRLWLHAHPSKPDGYGRHGNCSLEPKGDLGRGGGSPKNSHSPDTCAKRDDARGRDVMEMIDKTVDVESTSGACVHPQGLDPQASTSLLRRDRRL